MYSTTPVTLKQLCFSVKMRSRIVLLLTFFTVVHCEDIKVFTSQRSDHKVVRLSQPVIPLKTRTQVDKSKILDWNKSVIDLFRFIDKYSCFKQIKI